MFIHNNGIVTTGHVEKSAETLGKGVYKVCFNPSSGFYLTVEADFILPPKFYGNTEQMSDMISAAYLSSERGLGALLSGLKGAGKTVLAKHISVNFDGPTILVNSGFVGESFISFINEVTKTQRTVIIFDEFEKVYDHESQATLLTLLDGTNDSSQNLYLLTTNGKVRDEFLNRPGRAYYAINYGSLTIDVIREVLKDMLIYPEETNNIVKALSFATAVSFDMLISAIKEVNRVGDSTTLRYLNIFADSSIGVYYDLTFTDSDGKKWSKDSLYKCGGDLIRGLDTQVKEVLTLEMLEHPDLAYRKAEYLERIKDGQTSASAIRTISTHSWADVNEFGDLVSFDCDLSTYNYKFSCGAELIFKKIPSFDKYSSIM